MGWTGRGVARLAAVAALSLMAALCGEASAQEKSLKGVALVVSQSDYETLQDLANPSNDAREIQKLLTDLGFEVSAVADRDRRRLTRELDRFVEDAEEADVALIYYSGHGIEAGGANYLVPVDAADDALDAADARLVPLSTYIDALQRTVPVTIVLLDACRTNPFPAGAVLRTDDEPQGLPVTASGLGAPRSVTPMRMTSAAVEETFGIVIGYAAEPGQVALDGEPGGNSPYAEALARHLGAMSGEEFGQVLRMVAEEVYLKTGGRQRPWVNESLRRLLYFGSAAEEPGGAEGDILRERRKLLLTIARLGGQTRTQVETIARSGDVPMDTLFGLLRALGAEAPSDPAELDKLLRGRTEELRRLLAERSAMTTSDPEIARLSKLAAEAVAEGAIDTALAIHEDIKRRVVDLSASLDRAQADIEQRRREFAEAYEASARAYALAFDYQRAATDMNAAFEQVKAFDRDLAWRYRNNEALQLLDQGQIKGDNAALAQSIKVFGDALAYAPREAKPADWALTKNNIGVGLRILGERLGDVTMIETAAAMHRDALEVFRRDTSGDDWAWTQASLANALLTLSERNDDNATFQQAIDAYKQALEVRTREANPPEWARLEQNLGTALYGLARRRDDPAVTQEAIDSLRRALTIYTRETIPLEWANSSTNLAAALRLQSSLSNRPEALDEAIEIYREVLEVRTQERSPIGWANVNNNLANALMDKARLTADDGFVEEAIRIYDDALKVQTLEHTPLEWAQTRRNIGLAYEYLFDRDRKPEHIDRAIAEMRLALLGATRERGPIGWAGGLATLAAVLDKKAELTDDMALFQEARRAYLDALGALNPTDSPSQWSAARYNLALINYKIGWKTRDLAMLRDASDMLRERLAFRQRARSTTDDAQTNYNLGLAAVESAKISGDPADRRAAVAAFQLALPGYGGEKNQADRIYINGVLGDQLLELSYLEEDPDLARQAVGYLRTAADGARPDPGSVNRSNALHQLARAIMRLAELTADRAAMQDAERRFVEASELFDKAGIPDDRMIALSNAAAAALAAGDMVQAQVDDYERAVPYLQTVLDHGRETGNASGMAGALSGLGRAAESIWLRTKAPARLGEAERYYAEAATTWPADSSWNAAVDKLSLGRVLLYDDSQPTRVEQANAAYAAAASLFGDDAQPGAVALAYNGLAYSRTLLAESGGAEADFDSAVASARQALDAQTRSGATDNLPAVRDTLCRALTGLGGVRKDKGLVTEAIALCEASVAGFTESGDSAGLVEATLTLGRARETLARLD